MAIAFHCPTLRPGVEMITSPGAVTFRYLDFSRTLGTGPLAPDEVTTLLRCFDGTRTVEQVQALYAKWPPQQLLGLLQVLDQEWLLCEGAPRRDDGISGTQLVVQCESYFRHLQRMLGIPRLQQLRGSGEASLGLVHGYTLEYYQITARAQDCITPSLVFGGALPFRKEFREFFLEEYRHDLMLLRALESAGFERQAIVDAPPLPQTNALVNLLSSLAHQDPLSYMAVLFIFEGKPWEDDGYIESLEQYDLPEEYVRFQRVHDELNRGGDHGMMSRALLAGVEYVSLEQRDRVLRNVHLVWTTYFQMFDAVVEYYGDEANPLPRRRAEGVETIGSVEGLLAFKQALVGELSRHPLIERLADGRLADEVLDALLVQLGLFFDRALSAVGAGLARQTITPVREALTQYYRQIVQRGVDGLGDGLRTIDPAFDFDGSAVRPEARALDDHLLFAACNDGASFQACLSVAMDEGWVPSVLLAACRRVHGETAAVTSAVAQLLQRTHRGEDLLRTIPPDAVSVADLRRAAVSVQLLVESFRVLYDRLLAGSTTVAFEVPELFLRLPGDERPVPAAS